MDDPIDVLWSRVLEGWGEDRRHQAFIQYCHERQLLGDAARRYRTIADAPEDDAPLAAAALDPPEDGTDEPEPASVAPKSDAPAPAAAEALADGTAPAIGAPDAGLDGSVPAKDSAEEEEPERKGAAASEDAAIMEDAAAGATAPPLGPYVRPRAADARKRLAAITILAMAAIDENRSPNLYERSKVILRVVAVVLFIAALTALGLVMRAVYGP